MSMTSITLSLRPLRLCASKDSVARVMATKSTVKKSKKKDDYFSNSEKKGDYCEHHSHLSIGYSRRSYNNCLTYI